MKAMEAVTIISRVAASYPSNTDEWKALQVAAGTLAGCHMAGIIPTDENGHIPVPETIRRRIERDARNTNN